MNVVRCALLLFICMVSNRILNSDANFSDEAMSSAINTRSMPTKKATVHIHKGAILTKRKMNEANFGSELTELHNEITRKKSMLRQIADEKKKRELRIQKALKESIRKEQERQQKIAKRKAKQLKKQKALALKAKLAQQAKLKKIKKKKKRSLRRKLLKKFYTMDSKKQIKKLENIYSSYGIKIKQLGVKDLRYLIKNTHQLLNKYHKSKKGRRLVQQMQAPPPQTMVRPVNNVQLSANQVGPQPRNLGSPIPTKGAEEKITAGLATGGSMAVKFPDSPPTTYVTQQPYYSY